MHYKPKNGRFETIKKGRNFKKGKRKTSREKALVETSPKSVAEYDGGKKNTGPQGGKVGWLQGKSEELANPKKTSQPTNVGVR